MTHEIRAEDGIYRRKYNAKRRQVNRLETRLTALKGISPNDEDDDEEEDSPAEATALAMLATPATVFLANEMERDCAAAENVMREFERDEDDGNNGINIVMASGPAVHLPSFFDDNYFSPLRTGGH